MRSAPCGSGLFVALFCAVTTPAAEKKAEPQAVGAVVETTLPTAGRNIRMFAFDGNADTYFSSAKNPTTADHFTLVFDRAVKVKSIRVTSGTPKGEEVLEKGVVELSTDGTKFEAAAHFVDGAAAAKPDSKPVKAIRIRPTADMTHPLAIREIAIDAEPAVAIFRHPVEFIVDVSDAPEMKEWADKTARVCERQYPLICDELKSDGFKPLTVVRMSLKKDYNGVAAAGGGRITGSVKYFKAHPDDVGAMVHETVHIVQSYGYRGNPGWLVEGVADYYRFFKYEAVKPRKLAPERAKYDGSYRITAAFLAFATEKYDKEIVRKLNQIMREGKYKEEVWKELTGKTLVELGQAWKASLAE